MVYVSPFIAAFLAIIYCVCFALCMYFASEKDWCIDVHKFSALFFTALVGLALFTFRILRGVRSRIAKYIHMLIHVIAIALLIWGMVFVYKGRTENDLHAIPSYIVLVAVIVQVILAILLFTYLYENQRWRLYFAPIHDIIGLWIFICLVGCCITGNWKPLQLNPLWQDTVFNSLIISATVIVVFVVLCPFFEWDLVGKL